MTGETDERWVACQDPDTGAPCGRLRTDERAVRFVEVVASMGRSPGPWPPPCTRTSPPLYDAAQDRAAVEIIRWLAGHATTRIGPRGGVHDGLLARNPCPRRTSPGAGSQRPYVATTEQVWALHDAVADHLRPAILLGAFVGLRTAEVVGLRVWDVDVMRGVVRPVQQGDGEPLKSEMSRTPLPIPQELSVQLSAAVARWGGDYVVTDGAGRRTSTWGIERAIRSARATVAGPSEASRFHDLRHYLASPLIGSGLDVKVVQHRLRHGSAKTTLDTYGHLWPPVARQRRVRAGRRRCCAGRSWGLDGD